MSVERRSILKRWAKSPPLGRLLRNRLPGNGWHQTMKNRVLLENYYLPGDLERQLCSFVEYYNHQRYHESLNNVTPADVYFGRDKAILREREKIKKQTIRQRRLQHQKQEA